MKHARKDYMRIQDPAIYDRSLLAPDSSPVGVDEPVILFRAQDKLFTSVLIFYKNLLIQHNAQPEMIQAIDEHITLAVQWSLHNPTKMPDMPLKRSERIESGLMAMSQDKNPNAEESTEEKKQRSWENRF